MTRHTSFRRAGLTIVAAAIVLPATLPSQLPLRLGPTEAHGRTFTVIGCDAAPTMNGASPSWVVIPGSTGVYKQCPSGIHPPSTAGMTTRLAGRSFRGGEYSRLAFYAAAGTTIAGITWSGAINQSYPPGPRCIWSNELRAQGPGISRVLIGSSGGTCFVPYSSGPRFLPTPVGTTSLLQNTQCAVSPQSSCPSSVGAAFRTRFAGVLINDPSAPALSITGGGLSGRAGWVRGSQQLSVAAGDNTGIQLVRVRIGDTNYDSRKSCNYTLTAPCVAANGGTSLAAPTQRLADGEHTVGVTAYDAAGNATVRFAVVKTDNTAPAPAGVALEGTSAWRGSNAFSLRWNSPEVQSNNRAPIAGVRVRVCPAGAETGCAPDRTVSEPFPVDVTARVPREGEWDVRVALVDSAGNGSGAEARWSAPMRLRFDPDAEALRAGIAKRVVKRKRIRVRGGTRTVRRRGVRLVSARRLRYGRRFEVRGRLTARGGRPRRNKTIAIYSRPSQIDGKEMLIGSLRTDNEGRFTYLGEARRSRALRFVYRGLSATVRVLVPARLSFRLKPRSVLNGEPLLLRGRVRGRIPLGGKQVVIQAQLRGRWRTFQLVRTDARGRYRHIYRFDGTRGRIVYPLRAVTTKEATFPYEPGRSRVRRVTVRGL